MNHRQSATLERISAQLANISDPETRKSSVAAVLTKLVEGLTKDDLDIILNKIDHTPQSTAEKLSTIQLLTQNVNILPINVGTINERWAIRSLDITLVDPEIDDETFVYGFGSTPEAAINDYFLKLTHPEKLVKITDANGTAQFKYTCPGWQLIATTGPPIQT